jgi:fucose permease
MYFSVTIPEMKTPEKASGALGMLKQGGIWLMVLAIFLGGAAECAMSQWASSYLEGALGISKIYGDIFGVALFALALGTGRTLYSKIGKRIELVLLLGAIGAAICYLLAALSSVSFIGLFACAFTGFCTSMLWPGSLVVASDRYPEGGVFIYALMAAGGDLGASVAPQLIGIVTDGMITSEKGIALAERLGLSAEELGMKSGMLVGSLFPIIAIAVYAVILINAEKLKRNH